MSYPYPFDPAADPEPVCDICDEPMLCQEEPDCDIHRGDWNGETGCHLSCEERRDEREPIDPGDRLIGGNEAALRLAGLIR